MFESNPSVPSPEEEPVTSRDEAGEPSGEEDPANEEERLAEDSAAPEESIAAPEESIAAPRAEPAASRTAEPAASRTAQPAASRTAEAEIEAEEDPLARAQRERDEYLDLARRAQADFENYRKRAAREAAVAGERARGGLVRELLPVVDNLERALASAQEGEQHLAEGVRLVHSELIAVLERNGVEQFDPRGEAFDPTVHEALSTRTEDGAEPGVVLDVIEKGYRTNGAVLRPARVVVSG